MGLVLGWWCERSMRPGNSAPEMGRTLIMKRLALAVCLAFVAAVGTGVGVATAQQASDSPTCEAFVTVGGSERSLNRSYDSSDAIKIDLESPISFRATASEQVVSHSIGVDLVVRQINIDIDGLNLGPGTSWSGEIPVPSGAEKIGEIAPGLYNAYWKMKTASGKECWVDALFEIEGSVFSSPIGIAATASLLLGGVGLALTVGKDSVATVVLTLRVAIGGKVKRGDEPGLYKWLRPRTDWSLSFTALSTLTGLLFGVGNAVFLQQAAIAPLSFTLALQVVLPSVILPPALSTLTVVNRKIHQQ